MSHEELIAEISQRYPAMRPESGADRSKAELCAILQQLRSGVHPQPETGQSTPVDGERKSTRGLRLPSGTMLSRTTLKSGELQRYLRSQGIAVPRGRGSLARMRELAAEALLSTAPETETHPQPKSSAPAKDAEQATALAAQAEANLRKAAHAIVRSLLEELGLSALMLDPAGTSDADLAEIVTRLRSLRAAQSPESLAAVRAVGGMQAALSNLIRVILTDVLMEGAQ
ncbi:MAG: hypothetical protein PVJ64_00495 [Gemmatimonadales bacterium]